MSKKKEPNAGENLAKVLKIIREIAEVVADGNYIYRGEPEYYRRISSSLYRDYEEVIEEGSFDMKLIQTEIIKGAKKHTTEREDFEILTLLQHYGGKTNLIDFTTDYLKALYFACDGSFNRRGRVILLDRNRVKGQIEKPRNPRNRVIAQSSIFVRPLNGFIKRREVVVIPIPSRLKPLILNHLNNHHGISGEVIYNDLHGFITQREILKESGKKFIEGLIRKSKADREANPEEKKKLYEEAIKYYETAIKMHPCCSGYYNNLGSARLSLRRYKRAKKDFDKALEFNSSDANAYNNRGMAKHCLKDYGGAIDDYKKAIDIDPNKPLIYNNRGVSLRNLARYGEAMIDFNEVIDRRSKDLHKEIKLDPRRAVVFYNRASTRLFLSEWSKAKDDLIIARDKNDINIIGLFRNEYKSIHAFQRKYKIKLPPEIVALLTSDNDKSK